MKPVTRLVAISLLALCGVGLAGLTGCSSPESPMVFPDEPDDWTAEPPTKKPSTTSKDDAGATPQTPPETPPETPPDPAPEPAPETPAETPTTTPAGGDPMMCMDTCAAAGPAAQYWTCSASCQDQACDDTCWNTSCGQNQQACESALDTCASQCGVAGSNP